MLAIAATERAAGSDPAFAALLAQRRELMSARQGLEARIDANGAKPDPAFDLSGVSAELARNRKAIAALDDGLTPISAPA